MLHIATSLLILSPLFYSKSNANAFSNVLFQTELLILQAKHEHFGRFDCVFVDLNSEHPLCDDWIQSIISSSKLSQITKYVVNIMFNTTLNSFPRKPGLVVMRIDQQNLTGVISEHVERFFSSIDCNTRVLVLLSNTMDENFSNMEELLTELQFDMVVYMTASARLFIRSDVSGLYHTFQKIGFKLPQLFRSILYNSSGRPIRITALYPWYVASMWAIETSKFLRTTIGYYPQICSEHTIPLKCVMFLNGQNRVDMSMDIFTRFFNLQQCTTSYTMFNRLL